jgi:chemotaxis protein CheX
VNSPAELSSSIIVRPGPGWEAVLEQATTEVIELMVGIAPMRVEAIVEEPSENTIAMVGLAGALCGIVTVSCSSQTASDIASRMLGGGPTPSADTISDALGEFCNMVAGNFKSRIPSLTDQCVLSIPTVISGNCYTMRVVDAEDRITSLLSVEGAPLWISLIIQS